MGGQNGGPNEEFREAMQKRFQLTNNIQRISPTKLYENTAADILGVTTGFGRMMQGFTRTLSLGEALTANWPNIAFLGVGLIVCFAASYMLFLRIEIRPGD
jgi:ABC-type transport system involved in multi-copper enzyme maturation permease subunit